MNESREVEPIGPIYIDENVAIYEGVDAAARLAARTSAPVDPERGIVRVERERWEEAQRYERRTWMELARGTFSDRNEAHRAGFEGYAALRGRRFRRGIELGCGPFTNLRWVLENCAVGEVHLLDPLIGDYLRHPFCKYRARRLGGVLNESPARLLGYAYHAFTAVRAKLNDARIGGWRGRPVTIVPSMIEAYRTDVRFDLVVMINVIEHCQDADAVLATIDRILAPGGVLVYHDKMYAAAEVKRLLAVLYDAGHPLRVDHTVIDAFLAERFTTVLRREHPVETRFRDVPVRYRNLYYIGEKR